MSRDPIAEDGGKNLYGFVHNQPLRQMDPLGLVAQNCGITARKTSLRLNPGGLPKIDIGHAWIQYKDQLAYGWWPKSQNKLVFRLGVDGILNEGEVNDPYLVLQKHKPTSIWQTEVVTTTSRWFLFGGHRYLEAGPQRVKGKSCECATCSDILECVIDFAHAYTGQWSLYHRNCITFANETLDACCLAKRGGPFKKQPLLPEGITIAPGITVQPGVVVVPQAALTPGMVITIPQAGLTPGTVPPPGTVVLIP